MYVRVTVYPNAKNETIAKIGESRYEIKVKEPPERNLANNRICYLIAIEYQVPVKSVRIISGHQSSRKIISIPETEVL